MKLTDRPTPLTDAEVIVFRKLYPNTKFVGSFESIIPTVGGEFARSLEQKLAVAIEGLEFYASKNRVLISDDAGYTAYETLREIRGKQP